MDSTPAEDELLVFGYGCKLFRDDEKALMVEQGHFSVPWMGDHSLRIDRFDARGNLTKLENHEALTDELKKEEYMTPDEIKTETMCNEERYRAMKIADEAEARFNQEELDKRVDQQGAEIGFSYDQDQAGSSSSSSGDNNSSSEITLRSLATVIEKTSEFIATQGTQMEILMRAKEAHNPKFQFLNPGNPYHSIYKQVLEKKKARAASGGNRAGMLSNLPEVPSLEEVEESLRNLTRNLPSAAPGSSGSTVVDSNNSYSQLVKNIKVNQAPPPPPPKIPSNKSPTPPPPGSSSSEVVLPNNSNSAENKEEKTVEDNNTVMVQVPPYEDQALIDKTASYVCRVGGEKLGILRKRMPEKFAFLRSDNKYNTYYQFKVSLYNEMRAERQREQKAKAVANANAATAALQDPNSKFPKLKGFFR